MEPTRLLVPATANARRPADHQCARDIEPVTPRLRLALLQPVPGGATRGDMIVLPHPMKKEFRIPLKADVAAVAGCPVLRVKRTWAGRLGTFAF